MKFMFKIYSLVSHKWVINSNSPVKSKYVILIKVLKGIHLSSLSIITDRIPVKQKRIHI